MKNAKLPPLAPWSATARIGETPERPVPVADATDAAGPGHGGDGS